MSIVCDAARDGASRHPRFDIQERQRGGLSVEEIVARRKLNPLPLSQLEQAKKAPCAVDIIRRDRDSR